MVIRNHKARHDGSSRTAEEQGNFCSKRETNKGGEGEKGAGDNAGGERRQPPNRRPSAKLAQASHQAGRQVKARQGSQAVGKPLSLAVSDTHTRGAPSWCQLPVPGSSFLTLALVQVFGFGFLVFGLRP